MPLTPVLPSLVLDAARRIAAAYKGKGFELFVVGGAVRDALLAGPVAEDLDCATNASTDDSRSLLNAAGADAVFAVGERFGTMGAVFGRIKVEVTTYRTEAYVPGSRKPTVSFQGSLADDLSRRDFTINAIAFDPLREAIHDPIGGADDLRAGIIRAVGEPVARFQDDPLRLLRAVRFCTRLGFELDPATASAARASAPALATISRERVREELNRMLTGPAPGPAVLLLCELGLAPYSLPDLEAMRGMRQEAGRHKDVFAHTLQVLDRTPPRLPLRWAGLLHDVAKPRTFAIHDGQVHFFGHDRVGEKMTRQILSDVRQEADLIDHVAQLVGLHLRANAYQSTWTDGAVRRFVREVGEDVLEDLLALSRADVTSGRVERRLAISRGVAELEQRILDLRAQEDIAKLSSPLDGNDLMQLFGRPPGPWIRPIKEHLLDLVLDGHLAPDDRVRAAEIARARYEQAPPAP